MPLICLSWLNHPCSYTVTVSILGPQNLKSQGTGPWIPAWISTLVDIIRNPCKGYYRSHKKDQYIQMFFAKKLEIGNRQNVFDIFIMIKPSLFLRCGVAKIKCTCHLHVHTCKFATRYETSHQVLTRKRYFALERTSKFSSIPSKTIKSWRLRLPWYISFCFWAQTGYFSW